MDLANAVLGVVKTKVGSFLQRYRRMIVISIQNVEHMLAVTHRTFPYVVAWMDLCGKQQNYTAIVSGEHH
ncbi:hypothetical protein RIF29_39263 [Crotalaria pallida]|uniref:Uncharacterized protein n=1 Tax=Crotalaria pallida TaxID=3830 RepID=A0AAN9HPM6_CROPI